MSLQIITPIDQIEKMILQESVKILNRKLAGIESSLKSEVMSEIHYMFESSPEYAEITTGMLQGHFGIPSGEVHGKLKSIVDTMANSTQVEFRPFYVSGKSVEGGITIYAIESDFHDILALDAATQVTEKGVTLPWLEWFLKEGDRLIIDNYFFLPKNDGRSGKGIMVLSGKSARYWGVPSQYSGTINKNWITRTVEAYIYSVGIIMERAVKKRL